MNRSDLPRAAWVLVLSCLLFGCHQPDEDEAAVPAGQVAVTTASVRQQLFHDTVEAWGSAVGDPQHARSISLAHAGQVTALEVTAGQTVTRGQPLLTITPDPAAHSAFQQAQSALTAAQGELKRTEQLAAQRLATQSQLATARKALADAQSALDAQRAMGGGAATETVSAPADGVVTLLQVSLGERVAANAPLLSFTPAHALVGLFGVQPQDGALLRPGMAVQVRPVYGSKETFVGKLRMVGQSIDAQTHLLTAQVELPAAASASLIAGAPLDAQIRTDDFKAWAVPRNAVLQDEHGDYLFQVEQGHAKRVDVTLRSPDGVTVGVEGPLDPQARVIVLGVYELDDGAAVSEQSNHPSGDKTASTTPAVPAGTPPTGKPGQAQ
ncbi:efflux RND transporter periplasmic adaptor subunit [Rhodanobacter sp. AS-Z3]|uniref:efflux RND transporter periplasmic adaptor subunit n=1 Tax=Rhodanobacter sp. AS-Z3 TaxID=3031330 RepID=UPI00247910BC|nr:efflux RND transporter periplasmic adaptor subunit [Rhodanobacter sp. AS-Z3]WEN16524.1 efflux RND transporter periplasmic adaptor subunit [Rhodanobacter sp. AS-Z3]